MEQAPVAVIAKNEKKEKIKKVFSIKNFSIVLGGFLLVFFLTIGCLYFFTKFTTKKIDYPAVLPTTAFEQSLPERNIKLLPIPNKPKVYESPYTGIRYTEEDYQQLLTRVPLAVMIDNTSPARPQSGISNADLVYEILAESGITRIMPIFWSNPPEKIGPVRSAREYFVELLTPADSLYMHVGYANTRDVETDAYDNMKKYGTRTLDIGGTFWRSSAREAPHNAYSTYSKLVIAAQKKGWTSFTPVEPWTFKDVEKPVLRGENSSTTVYFLKDYINKEKFKVTWTYDKSTNKYLRYIAGKPHTDILNKAQLTATNIVIQSVEFSFTKDDKNRVIHKVIGSGDAIILTNGKVYNVKWEKKDRISRTFYYNKDGTNFEFNRGVTWVQIVPENLSQVVFSGQGN